MKISIIIPVYNVEKYIKRCLLSCLEEQDMTQNEYEVIVVDDCSPDNSINIIVDLASKYNNIRIVRNERNLGQASSRNVGLKEANGEYILFLDSDDWIHSNILSSMYEYASKNKLDLMPFGFILSHEYDKEIFHAVFNNSQEIMTGQTYCTTQRIFLLVPWAALYCRKWMIENNLTFNDNIRYHEDEEFTPRSFFLAKRVSYFPGPCYEYRYKPSGTNSTSSNTEQRAICYYKAAKSLNEFKMNNFIENIAAKQYLSSRIAYCTMMAVSLSKDEILLNTIKDSPFYPIKDLSNYLGIKGKIKVFILNLSIDLYRFLLHVVK